MSWIVSYSKKKSDSTYTPLFIQRKLAKGYKAAILTPFLFLYFELPA